MKHQLARAVALVAVAASAAISAGGCGGDDGTDDEVPSNAVARVDDTLITRKQADTLLPAAAAAQGDYRTQGARLLVLAEWLKRDAKREGVSAPTDASTGGGGKGAATLAAVTGLTQALTEHAGGDPPPEQEIARYYREHPNEYARPEVRYMRSVATSSRDRAEAAKQALERGQSWKAVIARYSTRGAADPPSGNMGLQPGEFDEALGAAVYAARRGAFNGPVKTPEAWYVFELTHVDRVPRQSLAKVRETIKTRLQAIRQRRAQQVVDARLRDRYRPITICREGVRLNLCRNGPPLQPGAVLSLAP